jgi:hypothetical protein
MHRQTGKYSHTPAVKCCLKGGKVVGTLEWIHYDETIWKGMSKEQRDKILSLCQAKSATRVAKAVTTSLTAAPLSEVLDKIESLTHAINLLSPLKMATACHRTISLDIADMRAAHGQGVQVIPLMPISLVCSGDGIVADGLDCP